MKKLPLGIQNFPEIRNDKYVYIDKTRIALNLAESGKYYFLSRPRRFGKSLFLDTLKCLFEGRKELFEGLYIHDRWDWDKKYPIIRIDFAKGVLKTRDELKEKLSSFLKANADDSGVEISSASVSTGFEELIRECFRKYKMPVVILIDEYDKPILDNITDEKTAIEMRDGLRDLYSVIKGMDQYIKFAFLTGVSKFSKMNLFSGLNNLRDITLSSEYGSICGYTQQDVEQSFVEYLDEVDLDELKNWYNGYSFSGEPVYNPYDILLFFQEGKKFKSYWFETGTPTFLIDMIREKKFHLPDLESLEVSEQTLNTFDVGNIPVESLMFQTGYLTIKRNDQVFGNTIYTLSYPNFEVKNAFNGYLVGYLTEHRFNYSTRLYNALMNDSFEILKTEIERLFASIPYASHGKLYNYEGFYVSVMYSFLASLGLDLTAEDITNRGRADLTLKFPGNEKVYIFEFKVVEEDFSNRKKPLEQIKEKRYFEKYLGTVQKIFIIGAEFSKNGRNLAGFEWAEIV